MQTSKQLSLGVNVQAFAEVSDEVQYTARTLLCGAQIQSAPQDEHSNSTAYTRARTDTSPPKICMAQRPEAFGAKKSDGVKNLGRKCKRSPTRKAKQRSNKTEHWTGRTALH